MEVCNSKKKLSKREKFWIKKLNSQVPNGYNLSKGGDGSGIGNHGANKGMKHSEETKQKMRDSWSYEKIITPERNKKISDSKKGIPRSDSTKKKLSENLKGKTFVERFGKKRAKEIGLKIRNAQLGQKRPKQSEAMKGKMVGKKNPMYGKKMSDEFRKARREYFLSDKNPGKNKSEETKRKISNSKKGKPGILHTEEYKKLMSIKMKKIWKERKYGKK